MNSISLDPSFSGEMVIDTMLQPLGNSTEVTINCSNIPPGISREDNEEGTRSPLEKLAAYVESG